jgi:hypothetical protein
MKETLELDIIAIVIASILGIILHALHLLPEEFIVSLILLLLALHALHSTNQAQKDSEVHKKLLEVADRMEAPDVAGIESKEIFSKGEELAVKNNGEMWWFNTPLGFRNQNIFDKMLKPALESTRTNKIVFILDEKFKAVWERDVAPKIEKSKHKETLKAPHWRKIEERIAFRMIDVDPKKDAKEAHFTYLDRPFVMKVEGKEAGIYHPRYMFHVKPSSKLIQDLKDLFLEYKMREK